MLMVQLQIFTILKNIILDYQKAFENYTLCVELSSDNEIKKICNASIAIFIRWRAC